MCAGPKGATAISKPMTADRTPATRPVPCGATTCGYPARAAVAAETTRGTTRAKTQAIALALAPEAVPETTPLRAPVPTTATPTMAEAAGNCRRSEPAVRRHRGTGHDRGGRARRANRALRPSWRL